MIGRFFQLFLLASLVLLLPSLFYLSREKQVYEAARDYALIQTGHAPIVDAQLRPAKEQSQGNGAPPALDPVLAQSWKWGEMHWPGWGKGKAKDKSDATTSGMASQRPENVIMPKMENATAKAELGRATWRFLHTMTLRFPEHPTPAQRETLVRFFNDFALLYPCGDCARHFQQLLKELPPQTSSRMASALWLCAAHNMVNARLGKPEFPCDKLDETYDCGCGPEGSGANATATGTIASASAVLAAADVKRDEGTG